MDSDVRGYLDALVDRVAGVAGERLAGVWAVGSLALGGFDLGRSDIDVQAAVDVPLAEPDLRALAAALDHARLPCPARKLEFVLYTRVEAPRFALNLNTGAGMRTHLGLDPDAEPGFWFVLDVAMARDRGLSLAGAAPAEILPPLSRGAVSVALAEALAWWSEHGTNRDLALVAERAAAWTADGSWISKLEAASRGSP